MLTVDMFKRRHLQHTHTHTHTHAHTRPLTDEDNSHNKTRMQTPLFFIHAINTPTFEHNTSIHTIHAAKKWSFKCSSLAQVCFSFLLSIVVVGWVHCKACSVRRIIIGVGGTAVNA